MSKGFQLLQLIIIIVALTFSSVSCGSSGGPALVGTTPATSVTVSNPAGNHSPVINSLTAKPATVNPDVIIQLQCNATDPDGDILTYSWSASGGIFQTDTVSKQASIDWRSPKFAGNYMVTVNVADGKGGNATRTLNIAVADNRAPVIAAITSNPSVPKPGDTVTITCNATDPDGDPITFKWQSAFGGVTGAGNNTGTWLAPPNDGVYEVVVVVSDGKDNGTTNGSIKITVQTPISSVTLSQVPGESGTVASNSEVSAGYRVGDDEKDNGLKPYFSFDLSGLKNATVSSAILDFPVKQTINNPWAISYFMYIEPVYYGPRSLIGIDYVMQPTGGVIMQLNSTLPGSYDVTRAVSDALSAGRYQVRLRMGGTTNSNRQGDYVEFYGATLKITYQ